MTFTDYCNAFKKARVLVIGDVMLDEYIFGRATRISPEAPVMVVSQEGTRSVPGGAANVGANCSAMGAEVLVLGVVGTDEAADRLKESGSAWPKQKMVLIADENRLTTKKTRVLADHSHQVLRIDSESREGLSPSTEGKFEEAFTSHLPNSSVVIMSDYRKGALSGELISKIKTKCRAAGIPIVANPKPFGIESYAGIDLLSLNRVEGARTLNLEHIDTQSAESKANELRKKLGVQVMTLTLGGDGLVAAANSESFRSPAVPVEVYDEAGAGDTVIATLALAYSTGQFGKSALQLAAATAAAVVSKVGVAQPSWADLKRICDEGPGILSQSHED